jgi:ribosomal protein L11 methyltransferase
MKTWPALEVTFGADAFEADAVKPRDLFAAALVDFDVAAIDDNAPDRWHLFFHAAGERDRAHAGLTSAFPGFSFSTFDLPDEDWAARAQADLHAVCVGRIVVAPPWDVIVRIQPSMGFGTGHHATTRLCLAALQHVQMRERSVIDVGTGSGVLAITASLLGATAVVGIDEDPDAIEAARENVAINAGAVVDLRVVDLGDADLPPFDVVLANLTGGLLIRAAEPLHDLAGRPGHLVLSGFMTHEEEAVRGAFPGLAVLHRAEEEGWVCVTLVR